MHCVESLRIERLALACIEEFFKSALDLYLLSLIYMFCVV
ncbi:hypothetical protein APHNP_1810 [Anaplasma phagocytophilum str. ApNP]|uniref:Uncharacterized protein n=1 Tax=Anaplasma phagocytophilum str. ApNP TaxID=1359153 RepID=A0A0F3NF95_ANAPH|nr:hypothetical protein APHNP_1810 [Anaplasma phagocytophilum str. ApNP]